MRTSVVTVQTRTHRVPLSVEVKTTDAERQLGYSYRTTVNPNTGMLFVFPADSFREFQMRQTYVPLDMLFIDSRGIVTALHRNAEPLSQRLYTGMAQTVIEVPSPWATVHDVRVGDRVTR